MQTISLGSVVPSLIRTYVPIGIGALLSLLLTAGVLPSPLPAEASDGLVTFAVAASIGAYYTLVRFLERRVPELGWLLGTPKQPVDYGKGQRVDGRTVIQTEPLAHSGPYDETATFTGGD